MCICQKMERHDRTSSTLDIRQADRCQLARPRPPLACRVSAPKGKPRQSAALQRLEHTTIPPKHCMLHPEVLQHAAPSEELIAFPGRHRAAATPTSPVGAAQDSVEPWRILRELRLASSGRAVQIRMQDIVITMSIWLGVLWATDRRSR